MRRQIRGPAFTEKYAERNERIFTGFKKGRTQKDLGNEFGLRQPSVSWICRCWFLSEGGELRLHYKARNLLYLVTGLKKVTLVDLHKVLREFSEKHGNWRTGFRIKAREAGFEQTECAIQEIERVATEKRIL